MKMTVKQLMEKLSHVPPNADIFVEYPDPYTNGQENDDGAVSLSNNITLRTSKRLNSLTIECN